MPGEAKVGMRRANAGIEIGDGRPAGVENQLLHLVAGAFENVGDEVDGAVRVRCYGRLSD